MREWQVKRAHEERGQRGAMQKAWIVGEYTLSRNLASLRVGRKPSARFIAGKIAGVLEHVKTMVREIISPSDRQACGCNFSGN